MLWRVAVASLVVAGAAAPAAAAAPAGTLAPRAPGVTPPLLLPDAPPTPRTAYRTLDAFPRDAAALAAAHPSLVRTFPLTRRSAEGRPLTAIEVASDVARTDDGRPVFVVLGTVHAREWAGGEVAVTFAEDLATRWASTERVRALLDRVRVLVVPVVDPDGFVRSRSGRERWWRTNAQGVDLNRNAGAGWGGAGASDRPGAANFRGPGPWSAPEAQAVHELLRTRAVTGLVSLHSFAGVVVHPPGVRGAPVTPDERVLDRLTDAMGAAAGYPAGRVDEVLYEVTGSLDDWAFAEQGALAATIELGGRSFFGPMRRTSPTPTSAAARPAAATAGAAPPVEACGRRSCSPPRPPRTPPATAS